MFLRRAGGVWLLVLSLTQPVVAAQPNEAEARYNEGLKAFEAGNYVAACQKLAESYRLDPLPGALFTLATCEMRAGRLATAANRFTEFLELVERLPAEGKQRQAERAAVATRERAALYPKLPHLKVVLNDSASTSSVALNGTPLPATSLNVELAVDPGEQLIEQHLKNGHVLSQRIVLGSGESKLVVLNANEGTAAEPHATGRDTPHDDRRSNAVAYAIGGVGAAGIVVGAIAGGLAMHQASIVKANCDGPACNPNGKEAADQGRTEALVSTIAFGVGVAGVATAVLLLTTGKSRNTAPESAKLDLRLTPRSITLQGSF